MRARGLLLAALLLGACASDTSGHSASTLGPQSAGPTSVTLTSVTLTSVSDTSVSDTSVSGTSVTGTSVTGTSVTGTSVSGTSATSVLATAVPPTAITAPSVTGTSGPGTTVTGTTRPGTTVTVPPVGATPADRPFEVYVPSSYDGSTAAPLILLLHGYTVSNDVQEAYFNLEPLADERGFLYVRPQGTKDRRGSSFWNATDGCCNFFGSSIDDSAYLASLIAQVQARYEVDPKRIFVIGHSNGGFMSYRMACDHADTIAAIVSLAGATYHDESACAPAQPVSVLEIHGTADGVIRYEGGRFVSAYPSAPATVQMWAAYNGCGQTPVQLDSQRDLERDIQGDDTTVSHFANCPSGIDVELWTIDGGAHIPALSSTFGQQAIEYLYAHPKP